MLRPHRHDAHGSGTRASLFRGGVAFRLVPALALSALVWIAIAWARAL